MTIPGKEIFSCHDRHGPIQVFDDGNKRYLAFGNDDEQSCLLKNAPSHLQYDYTKAMLLPLIFETKDLQPAEKQILILGLGAGSLANCLLKQLPDHSLTAVELRQAVIDVAYDYFELSNHISLTVLTADAKHHIENDRQQYRLIFSDIYSASGMDDAQAQKSYLTHCLRLLATHGWLVLNFWREHRANDQLLNFLKLHCQEIRIVTTESGNWIVMASKQRQIIGHKQLLSNAKRLAEPLGFSLLPSLKRLQTIKHKAY